MTLERMIIRDRGIKRKANLGRAADEKDQGQRIKASVLSPLFAWGNEERALTRSHEDTKMKD